MPRKTDPGPSLFGPADGEETVEGTGAYGQPLAPAPRIASGPAAAPGSPEQRARLRVVVAELAGEVIEEELGRIRSEVRRAVELLDRAIGEERPSGLCTVRAILEGILNHRDSTEEVP